MNTTTVGNLSMAAVLHKLVAAGKNVSVPFGDGCRYDLVLEKEDKLLRVQVKTGKLDAGVIRVLVSSPTRKTKGKGWGMKDYKGQVDVFAVYCPQNDKVYIVSADNVGKNQIYLRVDQPKKMRKDIRWAKDCELG